MSRKRAGYGNLLHQDMGAKHAGLMQDYVVLQQEHAAVEGRLQTAKMRKATLLAEVRFLRRRLKKLKENPSDLKEKETSFAIPQSHEKADPQTRMEEPSTLSAKNTSVPVLWEPLLRNGCVEFPKPISDNMGLVSVLKTSTYRNGSNRFAGATDLWIIIFFGYVHLLNKDQLLSHMKDWQIHYQLQKEKGTAIWVEIICNLLRSSKNKSVVGIIFNLELFQSSKFVRDCFIPTIFTLDSSALVY